MTWFWWAILAVVAYSILGVLFKLVSNVEKNPLLISFMYLFVSSLCSFPLIIREGANFNVSSFVWFMLGLSIVVYTLASTFNFRAFQVADVSTATILTRSAPLWILIGGVFLFGEQLSPKQILGCLLVLAAIIILGLTGKRIKFERGELLALFSGLMFGAGALFDKWLLNYFNLSWYLFLSLFLTAVAIFVTFRKQIDLNGLLSKRKFLLMILIMGLLLTIGNVFLFTAYKDNGYVSLTNIITQMRIPIISLVGIVFLKERDKILNKIIATALIVIGIILLA